MKKWLFLLIVADGLFGLGVGLTLGGFVAASCVDGICSASPTDLGSIGLTVALLGFIVTSVVGMSLLAGLPAEKRGRRPVGLLKAFLSRPRGGK